MRYWLRLPLVWLVLVAGVVLAVLASAPRVAARPVEEPSDLRTVRPSKLRTFGPSDHSPSPQSLPPAIDALLKSIHSADTGQLAVSEEDGRFLRVLVAASRCRRALEIGGANGYSSIWIGMGLR